MARHRRPAPLWVNVVLLTMIGATVALATFLRS